MKRFAVRNYGLTRQIPYKDQQVFIANDGVIETDDEELVAVLRKHENLYVTDRSPSSLPVDVPEKPEEPEASEEIPYKDMTVKELQVLMKDRQMKTSGLNKADLIQALVDYDEAPVEEEVLEEVTA